MSPIRLALWRAKKMGNDQEIESAHYLPPVGVVPLLTEHSL